MQFLYWWEKLNNELAYRGEPAALYGEARRWYDSLGPAKPLEERHVNRIVNSRRPL